MTDTLKDIITPFSGFVYALGIIAFFVALYFLLIGRRRWRDHEVWRRLAIRWSTLVLALSVVYLVQFGLRLFMPKLLSNDEWTYLLVGSLVAALLLGAYVFWFYQTQYNAVITSYEKRRKQREMRNKPVGGILTKENMPLPTGNYPRAGQDKEDKAPVKNSRPKR